MRGANNLQRQLAALTARHGITLAQPCRVPLIASPEHISLILEGVASTSAIDIDRVRFAPRCFGPTLPTVPLLLEHDPSRPAGQVTPTYDPTGGLRVRTAPLSAAAARYGAFSISVRNIQFQIHNADTRHFHAEITAADLTEISLTEYPHLEAARVVQRLRPNPQVEFYNAAQRGFEIIGLKLALLQRQMEASR